MANEEVFDDEFYQEDFSTASEWEAFVSKLSDMLEAFEFVDEEPLSTNQLSLCEWSEKQDEILFNNFDLLVTRYKAQILPQRESWPSKAVQCQVFQDIGKLVIKLIIFMTNLILGINHTFFSLDRE